ncbi:uncharacterized protein PRCAT00002737001 [Priceomyces carsonii]|uniref:uncharacterized protein n=1 Tax=Priceomyces carsonii TaxID=28549 RepID=UPI002ED8FDC7|nr:unnamed protein product [Priceomyces carsonii]
MNNNNIVYISSDENDDAVDLLKRQIINDKNRDISNGSKIPVISSKKRRLESLNARSNPFRPSSPSREPMHLQLRLQNDIQGRVFSEQGSPMEVDSPIEVISISSDDNEMINRDNYGRLEDVSNNIEPEKNFDLSHISINDENGTTTNLSSDRENYVLGNRSDDDLVILNPEEAYKSGKFKQSSFERRPVEVLNYPEPMISPFDNMYNQPAPVPHVSDAGFSANDLKEKQGREKLENYLREQQSLVESYLPASTEQSKYKDALKSISDVVLKLTEQAKVYQSRGDSTLMEMWGSINSILEGKISQLTAAKRKFSESRSKFDTIVSRLNMVNDGIRSLRVTLGYGNHESQVPSSQFRGYASNVYSHNTDDEHIQDLLDNIRPDEELKDGLELTPTDLSINLMKHQRMGLAWLLRMENSKALGGILADDMGLGKTIQALALIMANKPKGDETVTLIVTPVSLMRQWVAEIESKLKRSANIKIGIFHGAEKRNLLTFKEFERYDIIMTSYGTLSSEWKKHYREELLKESSSRSRNILPSLSSGGQSYTSPFFTREANFYRIILDEAQNIKNKFAIASKASACLKGKYRLCLSGTPIQNNIDELYPLLRFLHIRPYDDEVKFRADIALPLKSNNDSYDDFDKKKSLRKLRALLRAVLLRRTKNSLIDGKPILQLPEKHILEDNVTMRKEEKEYYQSLEAGIQKKARSLLIERSGKNPGIASNILALLLRLRQACLHSFLVEIGLLKSESADVAEYNSKNWRSSSQKVRNLEPKVIDNVNSVLYNADSTGIFSCPHCFNVTSYESVMIFPTCGHMICFKCVDDFFADNDISEGQDDTRTASCNQCAKPIRDSDLIEYEIYHKIIIEKLSDMELSTQFDQKSSLLSKKSVDSVIKGLIKDNNGTFPMSAKFEKCLSLINEVFEKFPNEKIIIFSQFTTLFDLIKIVLDRENIPFLRYDGSMSVEKKNSTIKEFYQGDKKVLLLSLRSGNVGLTLTCASHIIMMDPFWNPYVEEQAMDRAHRIGQEREVHIHRILMENTIESRIMELQNLKKELVSNALDENGMKSVSKLGQRELGFLFGLNTLR